MSPANEVGPGERVKGLVPRYRMSGQPPRRNSRRPTVAPTAKPEGIEAKVEAQLETSIKALDKMLIEMEEDTAREQPFGGLDDETGTASCRPPQYVHEINHMFRLVDLTMTEEEGGTEIPIETGLDDDDDVKACDFDFCQLGFLRSCVDESTSPVVVDERLVLVDERPELTVPVQWHPRLGRDRRDPERGPSPDDTIPEWEPPTAEA